MRQSSMTTLASARCSTSMAILYEGADEVAAEGPEAQIASYSAAECVQGSVVRMPKSTKRPPGQRDFVGGGEGI